MVRGVSSPFLRFVPDIDRFIGLAFGVFGSDGVSDRQRDLSRAGRGPVLACHETCVQR